MSNQICDSCKRREFVHILDGVKWTCVCGHVNTVSETKEIEMNEEKVSEQSTDHPRARIQNPTCGTCRWAEFEFGEDYGYCFHAPPIVIDKPSCALAYERPGIWRNNFCSHHESAFEEEHANREPLNIPPVFKPTRDGATST